ncbi:MAG: DUF309 domain-containing protein [Paracoccaceae bacterium]|nr:DUF309 domain-containing protein [Paracoccaceae bacterium]
MEQGGEWPTHPYIPGKTTRHAEDAFEHLTATAAPGMSIEELSKSDAFLFGLKYLNTGFYWEAHELFEPVWMALPYPSRERALAQGLIQIANGLLKLKMDRPNAARRLDAIARNHIAHAGSGVVMGITHQGVLRMLDSLKRKCDDAL